ncbi:MAG: hypothetical protein H0X37_08405 [Herpetosiphonaceae bacterium]|nr:hypothetical protein [Herpetosiphonaceae bacterium]
MLRSFHHARALIVLVLALLGISCVLPRQQPVVLAAPSAGKLSAQHGSSTVYLPWLERSPAPPSSVFGVEITGGSVAPTVKYVSAANVAWTRYNNILWSTVEPSPGARNWAALKLADTELTALAASGTEPIVTIRSVPAWAQQTPGSACGPMTPAAYSAFASFVHDVVVRYSAPPFNVRYWEMWNEPDAPTVSGDQPYGCWGDPSDAYYGGGKFGDMLKVVYPAIKAANPWAQVLNGGLILDCDPTNPLPGEPCVAGKFLEGMLRSGAGNAFDLLAYHAYSYWSSNRADWDLTSLKWQARGGSTLGRLSYMRSLLNQYGSTNKPIIMDEGGMICYSGAPDCGDSRYYPDQANYVVRLYSRAWSHGLAGAVWYALNDPDWKDAGLLDRASQPHPSYAALKFLSGELAGTTYVSSLDTGNTEGYAFQKSGTIYRIYWTNNTSITQLTLPPGTRALYDKFGQPLPITGTTTTISFEPTIIEVNGP